MKEKLQEYALLAEIISAICIVLSLIFVGLQVQQGAEETAANSKAIASSVRQSLMNADRELLMFSVDRPYLINPDEADDEELLQAWIWRLAVLRTRENYWLQYQDGLLDERLYEGYMNSLIINIAQSQKIVAQWKNSLDVNDASLANEFIPEFVQEVNSRLDVYLQNNE